MAVLWLSWGFSWGLAGFFLGGGGGVGGGGLALAHISEVRLLGYGRAEDEVALSIIELGVVRVCHPNNPALAGVATGDGALLYPAPVWDMRGGPHEGIVAPPPPPPPSPPPASFPPPFSFLSPLFSFGAGTAYVFWGWLFSFFMGGVVAGGGRRGVRGVFVFGLVVRVRLEPVPLLPGGGFATLAFLWGGGGACRSLSSFTSFASPPPISRQIFPSSHPNQPTSAKCAH